MKGIVLSCKKKIGNIDISPRRYKWLESSGGASRQASQINEPIVDKLKQGVIELGRLASFFSITTHARTTLRSDVILSSPLKRAHQTVSRG